ncbi:MAG: RidA family protein [bacterium]
MIKNYSLVTIAIGLPLLAVLVWANGVNGPREHSTQIDFISSKASPPLGPYATTVQVGKTLYLSGIIAYNAEENSFAPADITAQAEQIFDNLELILTESDARLTNVVKVSVFLKSPEDMKAMNDVYLRRFGDHRPARTTVPGVDWGHAQILMELEAVAIIE